MEARLLFWLLLQLVCFADAQFNHQEEKLEQEFNLQKTSEEQLLQAADQISKLVQQVILNQEDAGKESRQLKDELKLLKEKVENSELQNQRTSQDIKQETQKVATDLSEKINGLSKQKCDCQAISSSLVQIKDSLVNVADASDFKIIQSIENGQKQFCSHIEENIIHQVKQNSGEAEEYLNSILHRSNEIYSMIQNVQNETTSNFSTPLARKVDESSGNVTDDKDDDKDLPDGIVSCKLIKKVVTSGTLFKLDNDLYFFNNSRLSWYGAQLLCHSMGMKLPPRVTQVPEMMKLRNSFEHDHGLWVSASDIGQSGRHAGRFRWMDGTSVAGGLFLRGHPAHGPSTKGKQYCLMVEKGSAQLADWNCDFPMYAACYIPAILHNCLKQ